MKSIFLVLFGVFLLSAFAVGVTLSDNSMPLINEMLDNSSKVVQNMTFIEGDDPYINGMVKVIQEGAEFLMVTGFEVMRAGILFGHDNPQYFTPEFIFGVCKFLIIALIVSLCITPIMYLLAFLIMLIIWIKGLLRK